MKVCKNCGSTIMHVGPIGVQFECGAICYGHTPEKVSNITPACKTIAKLKGLIDDAFNDGYNSALYCGYTLAEWKKQKGIN